MFGTVPKEIKEREKEIENQMLRTQLAKAESNVDYLSMMSGIDLPEETSQQGPETEGGDDNE